MLAGKSAIITGGTRGIGFTIAKELVNQGANIVICSRTKTELQSALFFLNKKQKKAFGITIDVSKYNQCKKLVDFALSRLETINILVNNAGIYGPIGPLEENNHELWFKTIEVNLMSMVYCSKLVIPFMKKNRWGKIINLCGSGVGGINTLPRFSAYFTSKTAIAGLTEVLAEELKDDNIQVNCVSPGAVNTYLTDYLIKQGPQKAGKSMYNHALEQKKTGGTPPELVAKLVSFLSSKNSNHITGRFLSAKWNPIDKLQRNNKLSKNIFKLRRIDHQLFYEKQTL